MAADKGATPNPKDIKASTKEMKAYNDELDRNNRLTGKATKNAGLFGDEINDLKSAMDKVVDVSKKLHLEKGYDTKSLAEVLKLHEAIIKDQKELVELSAKLEATSATTPLDPDTLKTIVLRIKQVQAGLTNFEATARVATMKTTEGFHDLADGVGSFKDNMKKAWSGSRGEIKEAGEGLMGLGKQWTTMGTAMAGKKGLGAIGGIMSKTGPLIAGLGAKIAGPVGLTYSIVKGIVDIGMAMDQFVKDINKTYAMIRGPDIITPNVAKQFKQFNDMLYNTAANIRVGLDAKQITGFLEAVNQAGMNIENLNTGLDDYRGAIYVASKASKTLGVDLPYIASMMEDMMMNLRMNLEQVDKAFVQVAFDAKKSGLSTDRFWVAVKNATASLSMYGNFVTSVSKQMAKFTKTGAAGTAETADAVQSLGQMWKKMSFEQKASVVALGDNLEYTRQEAKKDMKKYGDIAGDLQKQIDITLKERAGKEKEGADAYDLGEIDKGIAKLRTELKYNLGNLKLATEASNAKNAVDVAGYMEMRSDDSAHYLGTMLTRALSSLGVKSLADISGANLKVAEEVLKAQGIDTNLLMFMKRGVDTTSTGIESAVKAIKEPKKAFKLDRKDLVKSLRKAGIDPDTAEELAAVAAIDEASAVAVEKLVQQGAEGNVDFLTFLKNNGSSDKIFLKKEEENAKAVQEQQDQAEKTFKSVVDQTLSFKEMQEMAKDEVKWRGATLGIFQGIGKGVTDIIGWLNRKQAYKTGDVKAAELQVRNIAKDLSRYKGEGVTTGLSEWGGTGKKSLPEQLGKGDYEYIAKETMAGLLKVDRSIKDLKKKSEGLSGKDRKIAEDQLNVLYKEKTEGENTLESLNKIDKSLQGMLDEAVLAGVKPEELTKIMDDMKSGAHSTQQIMDKFSLSERQMQAVQRKATPFQGLSQPFTVHKAEQPVLLHRGETILPKPELMPAGGTPAVAAPTRGQGNITINVNATQRDLAMAIGNEVRSVMHSIQMGR